MRCIGRKSRGCRSSSRAPHSGAVYPRAFLDASPLELDLLRRSEDCYVDRLGAGAVGVGAPLLRAHFPRVFLDVNREPWELDPEMFAEPLPGYVKTRTPRIASGLGTIPRLVGNGLEIYRAQALLPRGAAAGGDLPRALPCAIGGAGRRNAPAVRVGAADRPALDAVGKLGRALAGRRERRRHRARRLPRQGMLGRHRRSR